METALGAAGDTPWIPNTGLALREPNVRGPWGVVAALSDGAVCDYHATDRRSFRTVECLYENSMPHAEDVARQIAAHEAVCAERWKQTNARLSRIELVCGSIVLLLPIGGRTGGDQRF